MTIGKKIYDPVHGFIKLGEIEALLVDSPPFQRLHYIRQLGVTYLVYPGATHTRFEHSLGVMQVATQIYDQILSKIDTLLSDEDRLYFRQIVRLAALCHDMGHLPFSHVAEKRLLGDEGHEAWTLKVLASHHLDSVWDAMHKAYPGRAAKEDVIITSLGPAKIKQIQYEPALKMISSWHHVMSEIITGDYFGADRIDYLLRDSRSTGLSYGLFDYHQLMEMLRILPGDTQTTWQLGIEEGGIESCEALLLARHFMHKRVYQLGSVKALSFHMSRFMGHLYDDILGNSSLDFYLSQTDTDVLYALKIEAQKGEEAHLDAHCLINRSSRFDFIELPDHITNLTIENYVAASNIPSHLVEWHIPKIPCQKNKTFAVLKKNGQVVDARGCSRLLDIPLSKGCVYVASGHSCSFQYGLFAQDSH